MKRISLKVILLTLLFSNISFANTQNTNKGIKEVNFSLIISGGVSLGAYEAGYNWAMIKMLSRMKSHSKLVNPNLKSVAGASAGSINALLSAMYWCQKDSVPLHNSVTDNLFYETWVNLGIEDLVIVGKDPDNKSSLFTRKGLEAKGEIIIKHLEKPIFKEGCEVPLGVSVTKVIPIVEKIHGIKVKNQNFSVPLNFKVKNNKGFVENKILPPSTDFYISIPEIEKDRQKLITLLFASGAFPGAFQQVKLDYAYKGIKHSNYFIDGGIYDNVPLDLATALDPSASTFFFMDPSNMRKEKLVETIDVKEEMPVGFITTNLIPVFSSFDIMQSMKLYEAINQNFTNNSDKKLVLSSRFHPITGKFLGHFGAFLDQNFRIYDYYVGLYDAIFHLAGAFKRDFPKKFSGKTQVDIMNYLKETLDIEEGSEALSAYTLFRDTEFKNLKPQTTDRFSAIYNAFDLTQNDAKRYENDEFSLFLDHIDLQYLNTNKKSFLRYAKKDIKNWHKRPLRTMVNRISSMENDKAEIDGDHAGFAKVTNLSAWATRSFIKEKDGFSFLPLDVPQDKGLENLRMGLRFLPHEISTDLSNGGMSLGYTAFYYKEMDFFSGFEAKASYVIADKTTNFVRIDTNVFKEYDDMFKIGGGLSFFGDMQGDFYKRDTAYGFNTFVDIMDILRLTYVIRTGNTEQADRNYLYFGIENIPSLIYWLSR